MNSTELEAEAATGLGTQCKRHAFEENSQRFVSSTCFVSLVHIRAHLCVHVCACVCFCVHCSSTYMPNMHVLATRSTLFLSRQALSRHLKLTSSARFAGQKLLPSVQSQTVSGPPVPGLQVHGAADLLNSGPHDCTASTLPTEPYLQPTVPLTSYGVLEGQRLCFCFALLSMTKTSYQNKMRKTSLSWDL